MKTSNSPLSVTIVGAGNVATHLALALASRGVAVQGICSRTMASASALAHRVGAVASDSLATMAEADVYLLAVKDDALAEIAASWPSARRGGVVLHTAGSIAMDVIAPATAHYGVLYPMQTFTKDNAVDYSRVTCFIEGNDEVSLATARSLSSMIFGRTEELSTADRQQLHLAAVFACNFTNHMYALAYEVLERHGIDPTCLQPLVEQTAHKLATTHPHDGQTGPARRHDHVVTDKHLQALSAAPELQHIYRLLSESIEQRY